VSERKREAAIANARLATVAVQQRIAAKAPWRCMGCGCARPATVKQMQRSYCSKGCMAGAYRLRMVGSSNPNYRNAAQRTCEWCQKQYESYQKERRFCSRRCVQLAELPMRSRARKDLNHNDIVEDIKEFGGWAIDTSHMGHGFPDIIGFTKKGIQLAEIKNPNSAYGRKGLNKRQKTYVGTLPSCIYILRTRDDARWFVEGEFEKLETAGGPGVAATA
jgi:hypothetical protein